jgi:ribosome-associated protein
VSKRKLIDTNEPEGAGEETIARTEVRREHKRVKAELERLVKQLTALSRKALDNLDLHPELYRAIEVLAGMGRTTGVARQRGYVINMLRRSDIAALAQRVAEASGTGGSDARHHRLERWRTRLVEEGDAGLHAFIEFHPGVDRQRLRQTIRAAVAERSGGVQGKRFRELFQLIKALDEDTEHQDERS